jgi:hypothetical protein
VAAADQKPGRRRAEPEPRLRRRRPAPAPSPTRRQVKPATQRKRAKRRNPAEEPEPPDQAPRHGMAADEPAPARAPRTTSRLTTPVATLLWAVFTGAGLLAVVAGWTAVQVPTPVPLAGAVMVTTGYAFALAARAGGRPVIAGALALVLAVVAAASGLPVLLAGAAVATAVLGAVLGMLATVPAVRFGGAVRECAIAALVAVGAAFAANAYDAQVSLARAGYLTLGMAIAGGLALVYRLGGGLHGLGRRGTIMVGSGVALLAVSLAYTEALSRWGPPGLVGNITHVTTDLRAVIGAVPRPTEFLLGFPVLAWSVSTRARRRQGWWAAVFGTAGLAVVATSLLNPASSLVEAGLSVLYSLVLGLALGYLLIRADRFLSGARGRRARRAEEASAHRPEPGRVHALM